MDVNNYNSIRVVSPAEGQSQPEILAEAKQGQFDEKIISEATQENILALLNGEIPSKTPEEEVYRLLVVSVCNDLHHSMPFLFERIDDYTELLMPDDLLWENSILAHIRTAMTPFTWMFLSSYEKLRSRILDENTLTNLVRPEYHAFFESAYVPICAFTLIHCITVHRFFW